MARLTNLEIGTFVALFNRGGLVLNFSTNSFDVFTMRSIGVPLCQRYQLSKGKSLMAFLQEASEEQKIKLLSDLLEYYEHSSAYSYEWSDEVDDQSEYKKLHAECRTIMDRINNSATVVASTNVLKEKFSSDYMSEQINLMVEMQEKSPTEAIGKA